MIEKLVEQIESRFAELSEQMSDPDVIADRDRYAEVGRGWHRLERRDRHGELIEVGLARGQTLKLEPGPHERPCPRLVALAPEQLEDLEG